jgi:ATP-dependent DNA helicase RecG
LAFDELLLLQLAVLSRKLRWQESAGGIPLESRSAGVDAFVGALPFALTGAQSRALDDILSDIGKKTPMSRLLQGDVGSGKTVVAVAALLAAAFSGYQGALMAPTEILAEQHFMTVSRLLTGGSAAFESGPILTAEADWLPRPITVGLALGSATQRQKDELHRRLADGEIDLAIGTHALIQPSVEIPRLALVVVDEQHRFGVMQRASLREKGSRPHLLVMSATPIPRSLALTLYGDLDVSSIDELPPGRQQIRTRWVEPERRQAAYGFLRKEVEQGRQAFIVCPLIEESEAIQSRAATEEHARLSTEVFPDLSLGLLHGRMPLREKQEVMDGFQRGELNILVSTPVVEVGIDVPNASVMLIDGADRFGLAQLHQFRGRVGRGEHQSYCLLLADSPGEEAKERLRILQRVHDGFELAEEDLRIRGPGDYLGTRQSGLPEFRVARITDQDVLALARREAIKLLDADPELAAPENARLSEHFKRYAAGLPQEMS